MDGMRCEKMAPRLVTEYLDNTALKYPDKVGFSDEKKQLTFYELREYSLKVACLLSDLNLFKSPIAVFMEKCVDCISAFMGAAYSGNYYSPIDVKMPIKRIEKIIEVLEPKAVITNKKNMISAEEIFHGCHIIVIEDIKDNNPDKERIHEISDKMIDQDLLYVLFTSGSTGIPKGVTISHRSVIDYTEWVSSTFGVNSNHCFGNQAPLYFDNSVLDIYQALKTGARMHIIPERYFSFPSELLDHLEKEKVNFIFWVPSALCLVANRRVLENKDVTFLKNILFCGEVMPNRQLNQWRKANPDAVYANLYGPTEITDVCCYYIVDRAFSDDESLPIGKGCLNTDIIVLNEKNEMVEKDEVGELCVRGVGLSFGYYRNIEKTEAAFVQNPLNHTYPEKIYKTGDLVKYNDRGELLYIGRKDSQIKHQGNRIELGEIESCALTLEGIDACGCIYDSEEKKIALFYSGKTVEKDLVKYLKNLLPSYMVPGNIIWKNELPLNLNGKIDRVQLKEELKNDKNDR